MAEIGEQELEEFNLGVLKGIDPEIQRIVFSGNHVSVYELDKAASKWEHKDVKGPLFLLKRSSEPHYVFLVLNRLQIKTLVEEFSPKMKFENTSQYLIYQNSEGEINGLWFYDTDKKNEFFHKAQEILREISSGLDVEGGETRDEEDEADDEDADEPEPEQKLAPSVANIFKTASASPAYDGRPTPPNPFGSSPASSVKINVNDLFAGASQSSQPRQQKVNVEDLFQQASSPAVHQESHALPHHQHLLPVYRNMHINPNLHAPVTPMQTPLSPLPQPTFAPLNAQDLIQRLAQQQRMGTLHPHQVLMQQEMLQQLIQQERHRGASPTVPRAVQSPAAASPPLPSFVVATQVAPPKKDVSPRVTLDKSGPGLPPPGFTPTGSPSVNQLRAPQKPAFSSPSIVHMSPAPVPSVAKPSEPVVMTKAQLKAAVAKLLENDAFVDAIYDAYSKSLLSSK